MMTDTYKILQNVKDLESSIVFTCTCIWIYVCQVNLFYRHYNIYQSTKLFITYMSWISNVTSIIQGANTGCDYVINWHHIVFYKQPHSSLLKYFSSKSIYGRSSTCGHILVYNYFQNGSIKNLISYLERKHFFYLYVIFLSDMSHSYRDTQGGGVT